MTWQEALDAAWERHHETGWRMHVWRDRAGWTFTRSGQARNRRAAVLARRRAAWRQRG